ncbi:MAG: UDP-N-acetylmuramate--L-alanine ligase [Candidatus Pacebacteria bacterium]|nr:UDP-N-acetylmuramate--L-alanine ligase [Candidatus Paceibacterota bacterium]
MTYSLPLLRKRNPLPSTIVASQFSGKKVHFVGIGGSGMSGLAGILLNAGAIVSGSEPKPNHTTFQLMQRGAKIVYEQTRESLTPNIDLIVRSAAIEDNNPEFVRAVELNLPIVKYAQLLAAVMGERRGVAIAGTHGKTTTTAMTAFILTKLHFQPSWVVGGTVPQLGGGSASGEGDIFVAEACEYDRSFHNLRPTVAVVTNIDADHLDVYDGLADIVESFKTFAQLIPPTGRLITLASDANVGDAFYHLNVPMDLIGFADGKNGLVRVVPASNRRRWTIHEKKSATDTLPQAIVDVDGLWSFKLHLNVPGRHNLLNATMAVAAAVSVGAEITAAFSVVEWFTGVDRRMQVLGNYNGATIIDDYAHHPTEVRATLGALRSRFNPRKLYCAFQPHQASRTRLLFKEFAAAFTDAHEVLLADIYFVRDSNEDKATVSSAKLADAIRLNGVSAYHLGTFDACVAHLKSKLQPGDLVVTMGAGPICEVGQKLANH